jgi:hypothetical protein
MNCPLTSPILSEPGVDFALGVPGSSLVDAVVTALASTALEAALTSVGLPGLSLFPNLDTSIQTQLEKNGGRDIATRIRTQTESCGLAALGPVGKGSRKAEDLESLWNQNGSRLASGISNARNLVLTAFPDTASSEEAYEKWSEVMEGFVECIESAIEIGIRCSKDEERKKRCRKPAIVERCVRYEDES